MMRKVWTTNATGIAVLALGAATAFAASPADAVRTRHDGFHELGAAFKNVNDELRGSAPQMVVLQISARQIKNVASQQYGWFPAGSGPQSGLKTKARAEIWSRAPAFKAAQDALAQQANAFSQAVGTKDVAKIRVAAKALGGACAGCHKQFRTE